MFLFQPFTGRSESQGGSLARKPAPSPAHSKDQESQGSGLPLRGLAQVCPLKYVIELMLRAVGVEKLLKTGAWPDFSHGSGGEHPTPEVSRPRQPKSVRLGEVSCHPQRPSQQFRGTAL